MRKHYNFQTRVAITANDGIYCWINLSRDPKDCGNETQQHSGSLPCAQGWPSLQEKLSNFTTVWWLKSHNPIRNESRLIKNNKVFCPGLSWFSRGLT